MRVLERLLILKNHQYYLYTRYEDSASFKGVSPKIAKEIKEDLFYHHNYLDYEYWNSNRISDNNDNFSASCIAFS